MDDTATYGCINTSRGLMCNLAFDRPLVSGEAAEQSPERGSELECGDGKQPETVRGAEGEDHKTETLAAAGQGPEEAQRGRTRLTWHEAALAPMLTPLFRRLRFSCRGGGQRSRAWWTSSSRASS